MQVMEAGDVIGNDKVVGVCEYMVDECVGVHIDLCVTETRVEAECGLCVCVSTLKCVSFCMCKIARSRKMFNHIPLGEQFWR